MTERYFAPDIERAWIESALADPAFASLDRVGAPVLVALCEPPRVCFANGPLRDLFGLDVEAMSERLFRGHEPGSERLALLADTLLADASPRLERLRFYFGGTAESLMFLCRRTSARDGRTLLLLAAPGLRASLLPTARLASAPATAGPRAAPAPPPDRNTSRFRFVWRTDGNHRLIEVGPEFPAFLGPQARLEGRSFVDVLRESGIDPNNRLVGALAARTTWSGLQVDWPLDGGRRSVPIDFGAVPTFDPARLFEGFRGYGLVHADRVTDFSTPTAPPPPLPETVEEPLAEQDVQDVQHESSAAAAIAPAEVPVAELKIERRSVESNVVPLRPTTRMEDAMPSTLTPSERNAFDEISRALAGLASGSAEPLPDPAPADSAEVVDTHVDGPTGTPSADILRTIIDRVPIGIIVARQNVPLFANRTLLDLTGYRDIDALHESGGLERLFRAQGPSSPDEPAAATLECADGETMAVDARVQAIDWEGLPATLVSLRRALDHGAAIRLRALESAVRDREAEARELHAILDTATDGIVLLDGDGRIRSLNRSSEALFGCDSADVAGESVTVLVAPESHAVVNNYLAGLRDGGVASVLNDGREILCRASRGGTIPVFMTIGRVSSGDAPNFCAVLRDLTEWKKAEHGLNEARREAERASALKSDFLAKISHEIRTPLNAILGFAEVIMDERFGPVGNERYKDYMKDIHRSGEHVMSLVNDLLDLSKIEAGKMDMTFTATDTNAIVSECVSLMQPQANRERVVMRLSLAPRLPKIVADERAFRQIILNILSNAVKYNAAGGQIIVSTALTDAGHVVVRVRDTGLGMTESELLTALEPFRQVATSRKTHGTGLGLPLTKALVEANRAAFTIKSRKDEGTLVEITFPPSRVMAE
jgi:PAS domain S-box-containing protein